MKLKDLLFSLIAVCCISACSDPANHQMPPSAQDNVQVLPFSFVIPGVERERTIRLYLPPGYEDSEKSYPVVYMHDGQNLFDDATSYVGEWKVDETLNQLAQTQGLELIVVGIDNGQDKRMNELSPWQNPEFGEAEGEQYMEFIVDVVKPYIDTNYRTLADVENTAIVGSSMGGLISHYAIHEYPEVFSKAGIFSPSYWFAKDVFNFTKLKAANRGARLYLLVGTKEGGPMVADLKKMTAQIRQQGHPRENIRSKVVEGAEHNEGFWAGEFGEAIQWLFAAQ